jgi:hypothetical protein
MRTESGSGLLNDCGSGYNSGTNPQNKKRKCIERITTKLRVGIRDGNGGNEYGNKTET